VKKQIGEIRIYVACLASYNNGSLYGEWIDASLGLNHIQDSVSAMLETSPVEDTEEWAIHDYEGFESIRLSEYEGFERVAELAEFIEEHGELGGKVFEHYGNLEDAKTALDNHYYGEYESLADYAEQFTSETVEVPASLTFYIDYEKMGRDLEINDILTIETAHNEIHVFGRF